MDYQDFLKEYPLIKIHETKAISFMRDGFMYLTGMGNNNIVPARMFLHELCHFIEREDDKTFLDNFGLPYLDNDSIIRIEWKTDNAESIAKAIQKRNRMTRRELRVCALETAAPFGGVTGQDVVLKGYQLSFEDYHKFDSENEEYFQEQKMLLTTEIWWNKFHHKYNILKKNIQIHC